VKKVGKLCDDAEADSALRGDPKRILPDCIAVNVCRIDRATVNVKICRLRTDPTCKLRKKAD